MNIYLKQKFFAVGDKYRFTDFDQRLLFRGKKPAFSITKMYLYDANDRELFFIKKKLFSFMPKYTIYKNGHKVLQVKGKFSFKPKYEITDTKGNEYSLRGNFIAYNFQLSLNNNIVGSVRKKYFSFGDAYELSVSDRYDPALFCAIALVIDNSRHNQSARK